MKQINREQELQAAITALLEEIERLRAELVEQKNYALMLDRLNQTGEAG